MKIVIVGAGKVGFTLAQRLAQENHDVIVIEQDDERRAIVGHNLDVMTIAGNGASPRVLAEVGLGDVGLLIAVTDSDEVNMIACVAAKQHGVPKVIARVRNTEYLEEDCQAFGRTLGIDLMINPEMVTAMEIGQILKTPAALDVEDFAGGKVRLLEVKVRQHSPYSGVPIRELTLPENVLIAGILRHNKMIIPSGNDAVADNDSVFFLGERDAICKLESSFTHTRPRVERILIIGAGRIGRNLALLMEAGGYKVKVIDRDKRRCEDLAKVVTDTMVICGDGTDAELLAEEGIGDSDAVVCLTDDDKLNLLVALMAKNLGAQKTFARVGRPEFIQLMEQVGVDVVFSPRLVTAGAILRQVRREEIVAMTLFEGAKAEAIEMVVKAGSRIAGKALKDVKFPRRVLVGAAVRDEATFIPTGSSVLVAGDRIVLFTLPENAAKILDFVEGGE
jgi:trk system potassium uptake protein TrkA